VAASFNLPGAQGPARLETCGTTYNISSLRRLFTVNSWLRAFRPIHARRSCGSPARSRLEVRGPRDRQTHPRPQRRRKATVLGLANRLHPGGPLIGTVRLHEEEGLDFSRVLTFNLDEYLPMPKEDPHPIPVDARDVLQHVNIPRQNISIPDGTLNVEEVERFAPDYERKIKAAGAIEFRCSGSAAPAISGSTNPAGPPEQRATRTWRPWTAAPPGCERRVLRRRETCEPGDHDGRGEHPGCPPDLSDAFGEHKAGVVAKAVEQPPTEAISASFLQEHPDARWSDEAAAGD